MSVEPKPPGPPLPQRAGRAGGLPTFEEAAWAFLSRISPARRVALLLVGAFELFEAYHLWKSAAEGRSWVPLILGLLVLCLLLAFELAEHAAIRRDLYLSREIADWLLPRTSPRLPGLEIAFATRRATQVGSDYYNAYPRLLDAPTGSQPTVFIVMADVAGTGMKGALLMATFQASLRALVDARLPLAELSGQLSRWSWDRSLGGRHFTMAFFADLDPLDGSLEFVSAGHQPPVLCRRGGRIDRLDTGGFPLGALADSTYELGHTTLEQGDALVIFSDGVVSTEDHRHELYGEERLLHALQQTKGLAAGTILDRLQASLLSFAGANPQPDDLSFLVVSRQA